jgi:hemerythrin
MSNAEIDAQHQYFIALTNKLNDAIIDRHDKTEIERIMHLMLEDALAHFAHEERLFIEMNYPRAEEHKNTMPN